MAAERVQVMDDERVEYSEQEQLPDEDRSEEGKEKPKPCPRGVHGQHYFIAGRCMRCGEPEPLER
jgi:hypothetical protein